MDSDEELAVLADELQQRGDPHGELIATHLAIARVAGDGRAAQLKRGILERRVGTLLAKHHDAMFGELAPHLTGGGRPDLVDPGAEITHWDRGFAQVLVVKSRLAGPTLAEIYRMARRLPITQRVTTLRVGVGLGPTFAAELVADPPPDLAHLDLIFPGPWRGPPEEGLPDLEPLAPLVAKLEMLQIARTDMTTPPLVSDTLQTLGSIRQREDGPSFARSRLPNLVTLSLGGGTIEVDLLSHFPALKTARLFAPLEPGFVEHLFDNDLGRLRDLTLSLTTAELRAVMQRPHRVAQLERLWIQLAWSPDVEQLREEAVRALPPCVGIS